MVWGDAGASQGGDAYQRRQARPVIAPVEGALWARVNALAAETRESYGSRRMAKHLQEDGVAVGRCTARRLMHEAGGRARRARARGPITTESRHGYGIADNVLARHFDVAKPDQAWAGDLTDIWTAEGWWYGSVLLEVYSRKVGGGRCGVLSIRRWGRRRWRWRWDVAGLQRVCGTTRTEAGNMPGTPLETSCLPTGESGA
jgi:hypothetical protein